MCAFATSLPSAYTELEYITTTSDGGIINTGIIPGNALITIDSDFQLTEYNELQNDSRFWFILIGSTDAAGNGVAIGTYSGQWAMILSGHEWGDFAPVSYNRMQTTWTIDGNNNKATLSGDLSYTRTSSSHFGNNLLWRNKQIMFGIDRTTNSSMRFYNIKIHLDNTLVFNGIPAQRKYDCAIGMYDTVSDTFFTSANTDSFIAPSTNTCIPTCEITNMMETDMCLQTVPPTAPYLTAWYNNKKYYINLSENDYPIHAGSDHKLQIIINNTTYNAHDNSIVEQ